MLSSSPPVIEILKFITIEVESQSQTSMHSTYACTILMTFAIFMHHDHDHNYAATGDVVKFFIKC